MALLAAGTVAYDSIESPYGSEPDILGGSGTHFAASASLLSPLRIVAVVGRDFKMEELDFLKARGVDFSGLEVVDGKTGMGIPDSAGSLFFSDSDCKSEASSRGGAPPIDKIHGGSDGGSSGLVASDSDGSIDDFEELVDETLGGLKEFPSVCCLQTFRFGWSLSC